MKVTVTTLTDYIFVLDVADDLELENFKAFCEVESGFPSSEIVIAFNGRPLMDNKMTLRDHGIKDGDAVILQHMLQQPASQTELQGIQIRKLKIFQLQFVTTTAISSFWVAFGLYAHVFINST